MTFIPVGEALLPTAGAIHSASWQASHQSFCAPDFVASHTPQAQAAYLRREMAQGKALWLLTEADGAPVGIVSVWGSLIENLYVLPEKQNRGWGTRLLKFAISRCQGTPALWILAHNEGARRLYARHGFAPTGRRNQLTESLWEIELERGGRAE